jgi:hypothetical protein
MIDPANFGSRITSALGSPKLIPLDPTFRAAFNLLSSAICDLPLEEHDIQSMLLNLEVYATSIGETLKNRMPVVKTDEERNALQQQINPTAFASPSPTAVFPSVPFPPEDKGATEDKVADVPVVGEPAVPVAEPVITQ